MNNTLKTVIIFFAGVGVGSLATYFGLKQRVEQMANKELNETRAALAGLRKEQDVAKYHNIVNESAYANSEDFNLKKESEPFSENPYVISPEEFGELENYETVTLTYYADGVVADDCDYRVEDADDIIGIGSLEHFGEYEDDSVFVRNDRLKCDYEILRDPRLYSDIIKTMPHLMED